MGQEISISNISKISGLTAEEILDKMVEKKIGISSGGAGGGSVNIDPTSIAVGNEFTFGGTLWVAVHKTANRLYAASKYILATMQFDYAKYDSTGKSIWSPSVYYASAYIKEYARQCASMFSDAEKAMLVAYPYTGDLVSPMSYTDLNGGFSYFNSNSRRICYDQQSGTAEFYWTSTAHSSSYVYYVDDEGYLSSSSDLGPSYAGGFRPCITFAL